MLKYFIILSTILLVFGQNNQGFLAEQDSTYIFPPMDFDGQKEFAFGFINGTAILSAIPSSQTCDPLNERLISSINLFVENVKNITKQNVLSVLTNLVHIGQDIIEESKVSLSSCPVAANETYILGQKLIAHVSESGYFSKVTTHATMNIFDIMRRVNNIQSFFTKLQHFEAGIETGQFFNFVFLHDFKN